MSKLLYTRFTKLIINYFLSCNKDISHRSDSELHNEGDDSPLTKLSNIVKGTYKFRMEILDTMINDAFKKSAGYKYYKAKKAESEKVKAAEEPKEQNKSLVRSGRGKGYMFLGDYAANVPKMFKKDVVLRKTRSLTDTEETVEVELVKSISTDEQCPAVEDLAVQSLLDLQKGSKASRLESLRQKKQAVSGKGLSVAHTTFYDTSDTKSNATRYSLCSDTSEESANEIDDADDSDMDLTDDEPKGDDDIARHGVFMYNKSTKTPKSTYFCLMITSSFLDFVTPRKFPVSIPTNSGHLL
ncbi:hypothetical protein Tco_0616684 [Tanacetum coccineum]